MKRRLRILALSLATAMVLTACGGSKPSSSGGGEGEPIKDLVTWEASGVRELENFFILNTEQAKDLNVLCNAYSALLEVDHQGKLVPAIATEWGTDDGGLTWTFKLRDDVTWVDVNGEYKADCTSQDWVTALEWVLNFHKNSANNTSMPTALIKGAQEYYDYTKNLSAEEAMALDSTNEKFVELVGIEAPDETTLIYHCTKNAPYFDTLCTSACLYPVSAAEIEEKGVENMVGMNNQTMWYNGAYTITSYIQNNEKVLTKNPAYWDKEASLFDTVTVRMIADTNTDDQLYQTGEVDHCDLSEATLRTIWDDENNQYHDQLVEKLPTKFSYQIHLNYAKNNEDGTPDTNWNTAVANENFRQSLYYGLDLTGYWSRTNFIYPTHCENLAYTMKGLLYFSDGTDYVDKVVEELGYSTKNEGTTSQRLDTTKAAEYRDKAIEELTAKGVTFPVEIDYYILSGNQAAVDSATVLKEAFDAIGDNYVTLNVKTYVSSLNQEVVAPKLQSFVISGWGADYGDPENFIGQELYGVDSAYYSMNYSNINKATDPDLIATYQEFTELGLKASEIYENTDERYQAYVDAEVFMLQHALVIPAQYEVAWQLSKINDYTKMNAMFGAQNYTYKNWETSTTPYTTEQYEGFASGANA